MNNNTFVHKYIRGLIGRDDTVADMTAGNGNDTLFLSSLAKKVYAFDISEEAIERCRRKLQNTGNVVLIHDSHLYFDRYIEGPVRLFLFNLGFLPGGDTYSVTKAKETLETFRKVFASLQENGYIIITFYLGHPGGKDEYYLLDDYIKKNRIPVLETYRQDKIDSPVTYIIRK